MNTQTRARVALVLGVLLFTGGTVWAVRAIKGRSSGPSPAVKELYDREATLAKNKDLTREQRGEEWKKLSEEKEKLTPDQKRQLNDLRSDKMFKVAADAAARLQEIPEDQRADQIKKDLAEHPELRFMMMMGGPRGGGSGGTNPDRQRPTSTDPDRPRPTGSEGNRGPSNFQGPDPAEMDRQFTRRLDNSTPEQRHQIQEYRRVARASRDQQKKQ